MDNSKNSIDGYLFRNKSDYARALKEKETIDKLKGNLSAERPDEMLALYKKLISKNYFATPLGISFLYDMRKYLVELYEEDLPPVPVIRVKAPKPEADNREQKKLLEEIDRLQSAKRTMTIAIISMVVVIIGMMTIVAFDDKSSFFNAENKVLDKYSAWEEDLNAREQAIREREEAFSIRPEE